MTTRVEVVLAENTDNPRKWVAAKPSGSYREVDLNQRSAAKWMQIGIAPTFSGVFTDRQKTGVTSTVDTQIASGRPFAAIGTTEGTTRFEIRRFARIAPAVPFVTPNGQDGHYDRPHDHWVRFGCSVFFPCVTLSVYSRGLSLPHRRARFRPRIEDPFV